VPRSEKQGMVNQVFSNVASTYDVMNDILSFGAHRLWKDRLIAMLNPAPGIAHLDVAGGTGDVAFRILNKVRRNGTIQGRVTVLDISAEMIEQGKAKADAEQLSGVPLVRAHESGLRLCTGRDARVVLQILASIRCQNTQCCNQTWLMLSPLV
jgi:demethylmenaquinone methyltransferase / 2-methoxy-6-polyprenyl-1,4-benzoquinol methylase